MRLRTRVWQIGNYTRIQRRSFAANIISMSICYSHTDICYVTVVCSNGSHTILSQRILVSRSLRKQRVPVYKASIVILSISRIQTNVFQYYAFIHQKARLGMAVIFSCGKNISAVNCANGTQPTMPLYFL